MRVNFFFFIVFVKVTSCQRRIVGGMDAKDGMFPYAAYVLTDKKGSCTGSLLSDTIVLTAAHCVGAKPSQIEVTAGAANKKSEQAQTRKANKVIIHRKYAPQALGGYDMALIQVDPPFNMSSRNIGTISLSSEEWPQRNQLDFDCKALGWGRVSTSGAAPDILQHLDVIAKHGADACPCVKRFEQKKIICLEGQRNKGPCMGDSGGPLICNGKEVGITHIGFNKAKCDPVYDGVPKMACGQEDTVVTYIYICPELDWIKKYVPLVPAKPKSCSAIVQCSCTFSFITVLATLVVFLTNTFYTV